VQSLDSLIGDQQQLADLHARALVRRHHVGLHHHGHPGLEREVRDGLPRAEHGREVAADEAVHEVVADRDPAGRLPQLGRRGAGPQARDDRVERLLGS
jgi:hypothetical protein